MRWGEGQARDQAPVTYRPNAAQSVVLGGLGAHTREIVSPPPREGGRPGRKWSRPIQLLGDTISAWGGNCGPGDHGEETKRRTATMMLSRTG